MIAEERTRIAPTPSGFLHAGNAVSFLITRELAQRQGARLRLRIDDLDAERARPEYVQDIFDSLAWLGIACTDGPRTVKEQVEVFSQHRRLGAYAEAISILKEQGDLYACTCSRGDQRRGGCACRQRHLPFDGPAVTWRLHLPQDAYVRMRAMDGSEAVLQPARWMSDPVLRQRADLGARPAYQIASLVDDAEFGTTFIVRGEDLLPSTACQLYLAERLGLHAFQRIRFLHHPLLKDEAGNKLSKSEGALALKSLRERGESPEPLQAKASAMLVAALATHSNP
ncbi:MAG: tRNA glutamyl-Q synthetase [Flavobacteriales bacterium]|nr:tRNA glutamyl-Q synthetase [Flavobacteriales bacterium]